MRGLVSIETSALYRKFTGISKDLWGLFSIESPRFKESLRELYGALRGAFSIVIFNLYGKFAGTLRVFTVTLLY